MASIEILKAKFDNLPVSKDNLILYEALLSLDISDFKAVMEAILDGRIDIEDTRVLFKNNVQYSWFNEYGNYSDSIKLKNPRISEDIGQTIKDNIQKRLFSPDASVIKESVLYANDLDLKYQISKEYTSRTGEQLTEDEISKLLPIVNSELFLELSMQNNNAVKDKDYQSALSDLLSIKVNQKVL